jgi:hypothetical protein
MMCAHLPRAYTCHVPGMSVWLVTHNVFDLLVVAWMWLKRFGAGFMRCHAQFL